MNGLFETKQAKVSSRYVGEEAGVFIIIKPPWLNEMIKFVKEMIEHLNSL